MNFAENNRISHRQLYRQMILALSGPFLLCLFYGGGLAAVNGIAGTAGALIVLVFYVVFLIRVAPVFHDLKKTAGAFWGRIVGIFFLAYVVLTAAYLLALLEEIVPKSLVSGVPGRVISFLAILGCSIQTHKGMQKRGRMAEVSGGFLLWGLLLMMVICVSQGKMAYLREMAVDSGLSVRGTVVSGYGVICAFSAVGLLPFALEDVEKQGSAGKTVMFGILTLSGILIGMELLLPAVLGMGRLQGEQYPVIPLLAGADLPGNVLSRFDILWMGFLLYSLLYAIGSCMHYGHQIIGKAHLGSGRIWMAGLAYLLSLAEPGGRGIESYYGYYLGYIFVPGLLIIQVLLFLAGRWKRKKKAVAAVVSGVLAACLLLGGCGAVEPEKRTYPLALGVDASGDGFRMIYGMPQQPQAEGQGKDEKNNSASVLMIDGLDFEEIEAAYNRSQEKLLDMGHLQILILGDSILEDDRWGQFLDYLKEEPFVGEDVYVFRAVNAESVLGWKGAGESSVGEYIQGLVENKMSGQKIQTVTLREVYYEKYKSGKMADLPEVKVQGEELQVVWE